MSTDYYQQGLEFAERKDWDSAISCFREVIRLDSFHSRGYFQLGVAYQAKGELYPALICFSDAIGLNRDFADAYRCRGKFLTEMEVHDIAIMDWSDVIRLEPSDPAAYRQRAEVYCRNGETDKSLRDLGEAIRLAPSDPAAYRQRITLTGGNVFSDPLTIIKDCTTCASLGGKDVAELIVSGDENGNRHSPEDLCWAVGYFSAAIAELRRQKEQGSLGDARQLILAYGRRAEAYLSLRAYPAHKVRLSSLAIEDWNAICTLRPSDGYSYLGRMKCYNKIIFNTGSPSIELNKYGRKEYKADKARVKSLMGWLKYFWHRANFDM